MATSGLTYYEKNRELVKQKSREWAQSHPLRRKEIMKKWGDSHRDSEKQRQDKYRKDHPKKYLLSLARRRALRKGQDFDITIEDLGEVPTLCPLLEIPIDSYSVSQDNRPSIDRIDSSKGYIKGNVHIISWRANRLKNNACGEELFLLAVNLIRMV